MRVQNEVSDDSVGERELTGDVEQQASEASLRAS